MRTATARFALLGSLVLLVGCDHATKFVAKAELEGHPPHEWLPGLLDVQYVENRDVAFNLLGWIPEAIRAPALIVGGALALLALVTVLVRNRTQTAWVGFR